MQRATLVIGSLALGLLAIGTALARDYRLVDKPGAGVLRLRVAITEAEGSTVPLDVASTVIPQMRALSTVKRVATGTAAFVGKAGVEAEIEDSMTEQRLAAAVDRQVGQKRLQGVTNTWDDVNEAVGELDGHEFEVGSPTVTIFLYGADAEALFQAIEPVLRAYPLCQRARVTIRQGTTERLVVISGT
jgi:Protein of unknown function (DUF3313)